MSRALEEMADIAEEWATNWERDLDDSDTILKQTHKAAAPQWISVKDRLPEEDIAVLVYGQVLNDPPDVIGVRRRYKGDQEWKYTWESEDGFIYREDDVTHWMPLPAAPKEEE